MRRLRVIPVTLTLVVMGLLLALAQVKDTVRTGPGGMRLLPGYLHQTQPGVDTCGGTIWKSGGARIHYVIGQFAGGRARSLATLPGVVWSKTQETQKSAVTVTMTRGRYLAVSVTTQEHLGGADFTIQDATDEALAEALLMIMTYDVEKGCW